MTATYQVLVSDELLPDFHDGNPLMPDGFHVETVLPWRDPRRGMTKVQVRDEHASPCWEGKLVDISFVADYDDQGRCTGTHVSDYQPCPG